MIGPTIIELLLALVGIEIGPVAMLQKSLAAMKQVPRVAGLVRDVALVLPDLPVGPSMSSKLIPDGAPVGRALTEAEPAGAKGRSRAGFPICHRKNWRFGQDRQSDGVSLRLTEGSWPIRNWQS